MNIFITQIYFEIHIFMFSELTAYPGVSENSDLGRNCYIPSPGW